MPTTIEWRTARLIKRFMHGPSLLPFASPPHRPLLGCQAEVFLLKSGGRMEKTEKLSNKPRAERATLSAQSGQRHGPCPYQEQVLRMIVKSDLDKQYDALVEKLDNGAVSHRNLAESGLSRSVSPGKFASDI